MSTMTKLQRRRLDKLATYLESLPEDYEHFDMSTYLSQSFSEDEEKNHEAELRYARENGGVSSCGTSACAAGHGPAAGVLVPEAYFTGEGVDWDGYSDWLAGEGNWTWLFSPAWNQCDKHHWGAAARIRYLLDKGSPPNEPPNEFFQPDCIWMSLYEPYSKQKQTA